MSSNTDVRDQKEQQDKRVPHLRVYFSEETENRSHDHNLKRKKL